MMIVPFLFALSAFDFDEMMMIAMGAAGIAYVIRDAWRERKLDDLAIDFAERLSRLEANSDDSITLEGRLRAVEIWAEREERTEERIAAYAERVAVMETLLAAYEDQE